MRRVLPLVLLAGCATPLETARNAKGLDPALEAYQRHLQEHPDDLDVRYERAQRILKDGYDLRAELAREDVEAWLRVHPDDAEGWLWLAYAWYLLEEPETQVKALARAYALQADKTVKEIRAFSLMAKREWKEAAPLLRELASQPKARAELRFWSGLALLRSGLPEPAVVELKEWLKEVRSDRFRDIILLEARCAMGDVSVLPELWDLPGRRKRAGYFRAVEAFRSKSYSSCRSQLDTHLQIYPRDALAYRLRAAASLALGWVAHEDLSKALEIEPDNVEILAERALALLKAQDLNSALRDQLKVVAARPGNADAVHLLARIYLALRRWDDVVATLAEVGAGSWPEVSYLRATAWESKGEWSKAEEDYGRFLEASPDDADARFLRALCRFRLERFDTAKEDCDKVLAAKPGRADARALRALCLAGGGNSGQALDGLKGLIRRPDDGLRHFLRTNLPKSPPFQPVADWFRPYEATLVRLRKADELHMAGKNAEALKEVDAVLQGTPDVIRARHLRGMILEALGRHEEALKDVEGYGAAFPDDPAYHRDRGICLTSLQRLEDALGSFRRSLELKEDDAHALNAFGICLVRLGKIEEASEQFRRAAKFAPGVEAYLRNRIDTAEMLGRYSAAGEAWSALAALRTIDDVVHFRAALAWQRAGEYDTAMRHYDSAVGIAFGEKAKDYAASFYFNRAVCKIQLKNFAGARREYEEALRRDPGLPRLDFTDYDRLRREEEARLREHRAELARQQEEARRQAEKRETSSWPQLQPPPRYSFTDDGSNLEYAGYLERRIRARLDGKDPDSVPKFVPRR